MKSLNFCLRCEHECFFYLFIYLAKYICNKTNAEMRYPAGILAGRSSNFFLILQKARFYADSLAFFAIGVCSDICLADVATIHRRQIIARSQSRSFTL